MINELLSLVTCGLDIPRESESAVTGDARIRQPTQPRRDSETAGTGDEWIRQPRQPSRDPEMINELLSLVTRGFDSPRESETAVTGDP